MVFNNSKKAAQGVGTLIIFIALILVAAVAAGTLITTVTELEGRAEVTGTQIQERLGTGFTVIQIGAEDTSNGMINEWDGNEHNDSLEVRAQLSPGSDAIKTEDISGSLVTSEGSYSYTFTNESLESSSDFTANAVSGNISNGYVNSGDVVEFEFPSQAEIGEDERFELVIFPGAGEAQRISLVTPASLVDTYTILS